MFSYRHLPVLSLEDVTANFEQTIPALSSLERFVSGEIGSNTGDSGWIKATLLNSWTALGGGFAIPAYRRQNNRVEFKGQFAHSGTTGTEVFALPAEYRPAETRIFTGNAGTAAAPAPALVRVSAAGAVTIFYAGVPEQIGIDGIAFTID